MHALLSRCEVHYHARGEMSEDHRASTLSALWTSCVRAFTDVIKEADCFLGGGEAGPSPAAALASPTTPPRPTAPCRQRYTTLLTWQPLGLTVLLLLLLLKCLVGVHLGQAYWVYFTAAGQATTSSRKHTAGSKSKRWWVQGGYKSGSVTANSTQQTAATTTKQPVPVQ
jgi:hypothetical protein